MMTVLLTLALFLLAVGAMGLGVMLTGKRLQGSCGGLASGSCACKANGVEPPPSCPRIKNA